MKPAEVGAAGERILGELRKVVLGQERVLRETLAWEMRQLGMMIGGHPPNH